jgi:hypothetical protein
MRRRTKARSKRPLFLWLSTLWLLGLGGADLWRSITLWQTRNLLATLGSTLTSFASAFLAFGWVLSASALLASAGGLWFRCEWARHTGRAAIVAHFCLIQVYTWAFVRTGLLWERRWSTLALGLLATGLSLTALTWSVSRRWLGLHPTGKAPTMT